MYFFRRFCNILIVVVFLSCSFIFQRCDEYSDREVLLKVVFYDSLHQVTDLTFDRIGGLGNPTEIIKTSYGNDEFNYYLPLSLHSDSSIFVFEKDGNNDTLGISHEREFKFLSESQGMQVTYTNVVILPITTFQNVDINLYNCWIESSDECYTIEIRFY